MVELPDPLVVQDIVRRALAEDLGAGDITTAAIVPPGVSARAVVVVKSACVIAGLPVAREVFRQVDPAIAFTPGRQDGDTCQPGDRIADVRGAAAGVLAAERTALNVLQYLSGIATLTREYVEAAAGRLTILDTRKTAPGLRALAKYAVRCGGGRNHRFGLFDGVLIKDNHIQVAGGITEAVRRVRAAGIRLPVEVEVQDAREIDEALAAGADVIMLDNFDDDAVAGAVSRVAGRARIELSGGMTLARVRALAASGANDLSVGALTHSAPAADLSLEIEPDVRPATG